MLLLIVEDLYEQRHPPFKVTLRNKNPVVAQLFAEAMLAWAQAGQHAPKTTSHLSESSDMSLLSLRPKKRNGSGCGKTRVARLILKRRR